MISEDQTMKKHISFEFGNGKRYLGDARLK